MKAVKNILRTNLQKGISIMAVLIILTNGVFSQSVGSTERGTVTYRVVAHKANQKSIISVSNTADLKKTTSLFMPTAFTPDADGINDQFGAKGINVRDFHLEVFNRWGEKIFESTDINTHWDGTYQGSTAQQGSYVYNVTAYDLETNENISSAGTVALLR
jgi:gliding motility-associated-like protein